MTSTVVRKWWMHIEGHNYKHRVTAIHDFHPREPVLLKYMALPPVVRENKIQSYTCFGIIVFSLGDSASQKCGILLCREKTQP